MTRTGPNDASDVVWAICKFFYYFFIFFLFFFTTTNTFSIYSYFKGTESLREVDNDENGPKRTFGPISKFFLFLFFIFNCILSP